MISPATYEALAPALLDMLQLGDEARGIRVRSLLALYPEKLQEGLVLYLTLQADHPERVEEYMEQHREVLTNLGAMVTLDEELRANLAAALGIVLNLLSSTPTYARYIETLNSLNKKPMYSRLLLMLVLVCIHLPHLEQAESFDSHASLDLLLRGAAVHLNTLLEMASENARS